MIIEVKEVKPNLKDGVHALDVVLNIGCMRVVMFFEYREGKWKKKMHALAHNSKGEKGESKRIEKFIKSEEGERQILNHNQVRLYTIMV